MHRNALISLIFSRLRVHQPDAGTGVAADGNLLALSQVRDRYSATYVNRTQTTLQ